MSPSPSIADRSHPAAVPAGSRAVWMLLALAPGAVVAGWMQGPTFALQLAGTLAVVAALDLAVGARGDISRWNATPLSMAAIALLWLPPTAPWWTLAGAALVAWAIARAFAGKPGLSPFHPAMLACAAALVVAAPVLPNEAWRWPAVWIATAHAVAGLVLAARRCIRWEIPAAAWTGSLLATAAWSAAAGPRPDPALAFAAPSFTLILFFVATDPSSGCMAPRARWVFGAFIGIAARLSAIVLHDARMWLAMAGCVLLANAAAPWLDSLFDRPSTTVPTP